MRLSSTILIWLLLAALAEAKEPAGPAAALPAPLFSRQTVFSIPYRIDPPAAGARSPVEVQLHVSENRGPWHLYGKVPPAQNNFTFRAASDGDYWFMVRTRDDRGQLQPPGPPAPELWVIVDTEPPVLELVVERGAGGELRARWQANDNHLRAESIKLEYQVAGSPAWLTVAIDRPRAGARDPNYKGDTAWMAGSNKEAVAVRAEIADQAGNVAKSQQQVAAMHEPSRERTADRRDANPRDRQAIALPEPPWRERAPDRDRADNARDSNARGDRWQAERRDEGPLVGNPPPDMGERFPGRGVDRGSLSRPVSEQGPTGDGGANRPSTRDDDASARRAANLNKSEPLRDSRQANERVNDRAKQRRAVPSRSEEILPPPVASSPMVSAQSPGMRDSIAQGTPRGTNQPEEIALPDLPRDTRRSSPPTRRRLAPDDGGPWLTATDTTAQPIANKSIETEDPSATKRPVLPELIGGGKPDDEASSIAGAQLPPGVRPRMVNSPRFELEYEFESVGPAGVGKVELWGTRDGGRSWTSFGIDPDNRSPMSVTVAGEGLYGFRIVVESGSGLRGAPPESGEQPEILVGVDTIKPTARLTTAELGDGDRSGELTIHWEAADSLLAARPIALSYSRTPGGPWTTIAAGLANSGAFTWRLDNRVPDRVYLRLEARDEAGNVQMFEAADPVSLDPVRPKGRIRGVRPVGDAASARGPQWYYNLR